MQLTKTLRCVVCGSEFEVTLHPYAAEVIARMQPACDTCKEAAVRRMEEEARVERLRDEVAKMSGKGELPADAHTWTFAKILRHPRGAEVMRRNPEVWQEAAGWDPKKGVNVYLHGGVGAGKTVLGLAILMRALGAGHSVACVSGRRLAQVAADKRASADLLRYKGLGVLMIDDVTVADWTKEAVNGLWELMDYRHGRRRPVIVTANADPEQFTRILEIGAGAGMQATAASVVDRLLPVKVWRLQGDSLRTNEA